MFKFQCPCQWPTNNFPVHNVLFSWPLEKITNECLSIYKAALNCLLTSWRLGGHLGILDVMGGGSALGWRPGGFVIVKQLLISLADGWLTFWNKILQETGERKRRSMRRKHLRDWEGRNELSAPRFEENFITGHSSAVSFPPGSHSRFEGPSIGFLISFVLNSPSKLALWGKVT